MRRNKGYARRRQLLLRIFLSGCCIAAIILLVYYGTKPPSIADRAQEIDRVILSELTRQGVPQAYIRWQKGKAIWEVDLPAGFDVRGIASGLCERVKWISPRVTAECLVGAEGNVVEVRVDGRLTHHLILRPPRIPPSLPPAPPPRIPRIAIVVDDLGPDPNIAEELLRLDAPLTFSILPFQSHSRRIAEQAHARGREVILHLPLEPRGFPLKDPGKGALFVAMGERELLRQLRKDLDAVPCVAGVNNHMGSRFMEDERSVRLVMTELKKRGLFFLDSRTTPRSLGYRIAAGLEIRRGERDIFLDNDKDTKQIKGQLQQLVRLARAKGKAIGICHPSPATISTLKVMLAEIKKDGAQIVPLSHLLD